jgi:N-acetylglucosamine-6-phosphate deacetylase
MSLEQRGRLMTGYHADFVLLNEELQINGAWISGLQAANSKMK